MMNVSNLKTLALQTFFTLNRHSGWSVLAAACLCMAAILCWSFAIPFQQGKLAAQKQEINRLQQALHTARDTVPTVLKPQADENAKLFYEALGEKRFTEQQLKIFFSIAEKTKLSLNQAEYKSSFDKNGEFYTYQIQLPVKGNYTAIRQFCELVLLVIPYASLDEMNFKREAVANGGLEAKLRFTFYLADKPLFTAQETPAMLGQGKQS